MEYAIFTTNACSNDCIICALKGQPNFNFYPIGQTKEEKQGLIKLLEIMGSDKVSLTGGDPLRNLNFLKLFVKHYKGEKSILLNPLTFLSLELNKSTKRITKKEASYLLNKSSNKDFCKSTKTILACLSYFDEIYISLGNLQSPDPNLVKYAEKLWKNYLFPRIKNKAESANLFVHKYKEQTFSSIFKNNKLTSCSRRIACVGNIRKSLDGGYTLFSNASKPGTMKNKTKSCSALSDTIPHLEMYFNKTSKGIQLYFLPCCIVGVTPYLSYKTNLTLEKIAKMEKKELKKSFKEEKRKMEDTPFHYLLNTYPYNRNFRKYIKFAEELIKEKTGKTTNILANVYTFRKKCHPCEACNTVGLMLHRAKIGVEEWQDYLKKKMNKTSLSRN